MNGDVNKKGGNEELTLSFSTSLINQISGGLSIPTSSEGLTAGKCGTFSSSAYYYAQIWKDKNGNVKKCDIPRSFETITAASITYYKLLINNTNILTESGNITLPTGTYDSTKTKINLKIVTLYRVPLDGTTIINYQPINLKNIDINDGVITISDIYTALIAQHTGEYLYTNNNSGTGHSATFYIIEWDTL